MSTLPSTNQTFKDEHDNAAPNTKRVSMYGWDSENSQKTRIQTKSNVNTGNGEILVNLEGHQCPGNTTTVQLLANGVFTGSSWQDTLDYGVLSVNIATDQDSAIDGLEIQWSNDGITTNDYDKFTILANVSKTFTFGPAQRYYRVKYTNGSGGTTTTFHLTSLLRKTYVKPSSHRINDNIVGEDDAELVKAVSTGLAPDGTFKNVLVTNAGGQKISIEEFENSVSSNSNTQLNVTNFDTVGRYGADLDHQIQHSLDEIFSQYGDTVSVQNKKKSILKFGAKTTATTGWETLMTARGTEVEETLLSTNGITTVVSSAADTQPLKYEFHTISAGALTFGVGEVTLTGTTPATLPTACARTSRAYNNDGSPLTGNIYFYEGGTRTDANTHLIITAGDQQTQKAATSISNLDYFIVTSASLSVSSFTTKFASARIEVRDVGKTYWRPITQDFTTTSDTGTIQMTFEPHLIVASNIDVRMAVRTNSSGVDVKGGFNGYLAN